MILFQAWLVRGLPHFGQGDSTVKSMEYAQWKGDTLNKWPGNEAIEVQLNLKFKHRLFNISSIEKPKVCPAYRICKDFLCLEGVDGEHGYIAD